jgi:hypothetical protein
MATTKDGRQLSDPRARQTVGPVTRIDTPAPPYLNAGYPTLGDGPHRISTTRAIRASPDVALLAWTWAAWRYVRAKRERLPFDIAARGTRKWGRELILRQIRSRPLTDTNPCCRAPYAGLTVPRHRRRSAFIRPASMTRSSERGRPSVRLQSRRLAVSTQHAGRSTRCALSGSRQRPPVERPAYTTLLSG